MTTTHISKSYKITKHKAQTLANKTGKNQAVWWHKTKRRWAITAFGGVKGSMRYALDRMSMEPRPVTIRPTQANKG